MLSTLSTPETSTFEKDEMPEFVVAGGSSPEAKEEDLVRSILNEKALEYGKEHRLSPDESNEIARIASIRVRDLIEEHEVPEERIPEYLDQPKKVTMFTSK